MKNERNISNRTLALYETEGELFDFDATVVSCVRIDCYYEIVLDRTAFFPQGGGQDGDVGSLVADSRTVTVTDTRFNDDGDICHYTKEPIEEGKHIRGSVDQKERMCRMQNHGAEHLLCGLIYDRYGYENVGFHMSEDCVVFDVDGPLSFEQLMEIEKRANEIVYENVPITISFPKEEDAASLSYRSKLDTYENIRLVNIEGYDVCACCAPALSSTGKIGLIKIIDYMPHRQGCRITMLAGYLAYQDYCHLHTSNQAIMELLSSRRDKTADFCRDYVDRSMKLKEENSALKRELSRLTTDGVLQNIRKRDAEDKSVELIFTQILDNVGLRNLINECIENFSGVVAGFIGSDSDGYRYICASSDETDLIALSKGLNESFAGKGGGSRQMVQGSISGKEEDIRQYFQKIKQV